MSDKSSGLDEPMPCARCQRLCATKPKEKDPTRPVAPERRLPPPFVYVSPPISPLKMYPLPGAGVFLFVLLLAILVVLEGGCYFFFTPRSKMVIPRRSVEILYGSFSRFAKHFCPMCIYFLVHTPKVHMIFWTFSSHNGRDFFLECHLQFFPIFILFGPFFKIVSQMDSSSWNQFFTIRYLIFAFFLPLVPGHQPSRQLKKLKQPESAVSELSFSHRQKKHIQVA